MRAPSSARRPRGRGRASWSLKVLGASILLGGCGVVIGSAIDVGNSVLTYPFREWIFFGAFKHANPWDEGWRTLPASHELGDVTLGIAISGGGSRSAYFAACVLDALGRETIPGTTKTYLDEVDFISGVSGGSVAAAYYCANRHRKGFPEGHRDFFARMKEDLSHDFEVRSFTRFVLGYFALVEFTYYDTWNLFTSTWNANVLDDLTFADLDPGGPMLLVNATCYDNGQKFVFSRAPLEARELPRLQELLGERHGGTWTGGARLGATMTFETIDSSIARCPLTTAVAASSAVPGVLGPIVLQNRRTGDDVHLGDGGVYDNHGLEALVQAMLPSMRAHPERPAIILVIDGAGFFESSSAAGTLTTTPEFLDRVSSISWLRAAGYEEIAYRFAQNEALRRGKDYPIRQLVMETISLYDAEGLAAAVTDPKRITAIVNTLRAVPTRFSISDDAVNAISQTAPALARAALGRLSRSFPERQRVLAESETKTAPEKP